MEPNTADLLSIALPPDLSAFVKQQLASGDYGSASDYVVQLIDDVRLRQSREQIEQLVRTRLRGGKPVPMTPQDWVDIQAEVDRRIAAEREQ